MPRIVTLRSLPERLRNSRLFFLPFLQVVVLIFSLVTLLIYLLLIPEYYDALLSKCILQDCGNTGPAPPTTKALLSVYGLTPSSYAILFVFIDSLFTLLFALAAFVILLKGRHELMALLATVMLISFGTTFPQLVHTAVQGQESWEYWFASVGAAGWITLFLFFLLFPNGRFAPSWTAVPVAIFSLFKLFSIVFKDTQLDHNQWSLSLAVLLFIVPIAALVYSQFYRYRKLLLPEQQQQTKWIIYGVTVAFSAFICISILFEPSFFQTPLPYVYLNGFLHLFLLAIPVTLSLAILRKRLWEVDPVVNRTLVYVSLSACIVALYSISILYLGKLFQSRDHFFASLVSTVIVAILFAPLKDRLQRMVNRLMKGRHDDPYGMLAELRSLLVEPLPPEDMLDTIVRFIRTALRIPYVAIVIEVNGQERLASSDGTTMSGNQTFPIVHRGKEVGALIAANRSGEPFTSEDRKLLDVLIGHAGPIVDNFTITRGMKLLADDLQQSREKLVLAREEERRNIRRNLHDELAPRLAALGLNATAAEMYMKRDPEAVTELLIELRKVIRSTVEDIRTLVHDMRPASLDEWGLIGAIQERMRELTMPMQVVNHAGEPKVLEMELLVPQPLPALPAAVEVAAYWIVMESIANVVRHAHAATCSIKLEMTSAKQLTIEIMDNGIGIDERWVSSAKGGIGIGSIRERASELGGHCTIDRLPVGGTRVLANIPVIME